MKIKFFGREVILTLCIVLLFSVLALGAEESVVKFQGRIEELNVKKNMMVVNDATYVWDKHTIFNDAKGAPIPVDKLKTNDWVYIEGEKVWKQPGVIKKLYLLPKYIREIERDQYPFMH